MNKDREYEYDIFISYASEDESWVISHLYEPLKQCRTEQGRPPKIFFAPENIKPGESFLKAIERALKSSRQMIPIYSTNYFVHSRNKWTLWELEKFKELDPSGEHCIIIPLLLKKEAIDYIPLMISEIQWQDVSKPYWFEHLVRSLGLTIEKKAGNIRLEFLNQPQSIGLNHTFPPIKIGIKDDNGIVDLDAEIAVRSPEGGLQGSMTAQAAKGVATFDDLSFNIPVEQTSIEAKVEGYPPAHSQVFCVYPPESDVTEITATPSEKEEYIIIESPGEPHFFSDGMALAVLGQNRICIFDTDGNQLADCKLRNLPRTIGRGADLLVVVDWSGNVNLFNTMGDNRFFSKFQSINDPTYYIVGGLSISENKVLVGYWNGEIYKLSLRNEPELIFTYEGGVQVLAELGDALIIGTHEESVCVFHNGQLHQEHKIEPTLLGISSFTNGVVLVGEKKIYKLDLERKKLYSEKIQLNSVSALLTDIDRLVVMDAEGKGLRYDSNLAIRSRFSTAPGSKPTSSDYSGNYCTIRHLDGTRSLLVENRIIYSHSSGAMAVDPAGRKFALGDRQGIKILRADMLNEIVFRRSSYAEVAKQPGPSAEKNQRVRKVKGQKTSDRRRA